MPENKSTKNTFKTLGRIRQVVVAKTNPARTTKTTPMTIAPVAMVFSFWTGTSGTDASKIGALETEGSSLGPSCI